MRDSACFKLKQFFAATCFVAVGASPLRPGASLLDVFRSNARHYWSSMQATLQSQPALQRIANFKGWVTGDLHALNIWLFRTNQDRWQTGLVDLDEAGRAPFIFDFLRASLSSQAFETKLSFYETLALYKKGLDGSLSEKPRFLEKFEAANESLKDLRQKALKKYIDKGSGLFRPPQNKDSVVLLPSQLTVAQKTVVSASEKALLQFSPGLKILKTQIRKKITGGSQGLLRVLYHVEAAGQQKIVEVKELVDPAVSEFEQQILTPEDLLQVGDLYRGAPSDQFTQWLKVENQLLLVRERIESENELKSTEQRLDFTKYFLQWQGYVHGKQLSISESRAYGAELSRQEKILEILVNEYLEALKKGIQAP